MEDALYTKLFSPSDDPSYNTSNLTYVKALMERILSNSHEHASTLSFSSIEVQEAITSLPLGKAVSPDHIEPEHIRHAGKSLVIHITHLFNARFLISSIMS